jgi:tRNA dimethylallyltransferase
MASSLKDDRRLAHSCWYVTGATASGKSEVGLCLAERIGGEIISLDSMAVYRFMNIGTAKPTPEQQARIPHHLLDVLDPTESFSVSRYRELALRTIQDIQARGKQAVFVGGTALYLKALLRGIFEGPPADWEFRRRVEAEVAEIGLEPLYQRLQQVDPLSAHKLHPRDQRRIVRALEVYTLTGQPISHLQEEFEFGARAEQCRVFAIRHPRDVLHRRIETRVDAMFAAGLVDEVRELLQRFSQLSSTAMQAVGYREVIDHVLGMADLATTRERVLVRTRRFARHQETWFRGLSECRMLDVTTGTSPAQLAAEIERMGAGSLASPRH